MPNRDAETIDVDGADITISNPQKVLFPEAGVTKLELATYYLRIAPLMVPHVTGRPLTLVRFPSGAGGEEFYQKESQSFFPDYIERAHVEIEEGGREYISADNAATLVYLANLVSIPHIWITRRPDFRMADIVVWDLDPAGSVTFDDIRTGARLLRHLLGELGITPHLKLTGSRGLHLSAALSEARPIDQVFAFSRDVSRFIAHTLPRAFTTEFSKNRRGDRIYVDYLRNRYAQSFAAPFAVRSVPMAAVALPIRWEDLETDIQPRDVTLRDIDTWLDERWEFLEQWHRETFDFDAALERLTSLQARQAGASNR